MTRLRIVSFALGLALSATGAWAQDQGTVDRLLDARSFVTLAPGIQLSTTIAGTVELSPDQKLARAYALCQREVVRHLTDSLTIASAVFPREPICARIAAAWIGGAWFGEEFPPGDRAFIEEVARSLK